MKIFASYLLFALCLTGCSVNFNQGTPKQTVSDPGDPAERSAAIAAASQFVQLVDQGNRNETWPLTGQYLHDNTTQADWETTVGTMRSAVGNLKNRTLVGAAFTKSINGAPDGHYFFIFYKSQFDRATIEEKVVLNLEGGKWLVAGYFLSDKTSVKLW